MQPMGDENVISIHEELKARKRAEQFDQFIQEQVDYLVKHNKHVHENIKRFHEQNCSRQSKACTTQFLILSMRKVLEEAEIRIAENRLD